LLLRLPRALHNLLSVSISIGGIHAWLTPGKTMPTPYFGGLIARVKTLWLGDGMTRSNLMDSFSKKKMANVKTLLADL